MHNEPTLAGTAVLFAFIIIALPTLCACGAASSASHSGAPNPLASASAVAGIPGLSGGAGGCSAAGGGTVVATPTGQIKTATSDSLTSSNQQLNTTINCAEEVTMNVNDPTNGPVEVSMIMLANKSLVLQFYIGAGAVAGGQKTFTVSPNDQNTAPSGSSTPNLSQGFSTMLGGNDPVFSGGFPVLTAGTVTVTSADAQGYVNSLSFSGLHFVNFKTAIAEAQAEQEYQAASSGATPATPTASQTLSQMPVIGDFNGSVSF